jgi:hypothetical protein
MKSKSLYLKILSLLLLVPFSIFLQVQEGSSQTSVWSTPVRLSIDGKFSWFPELAADQTGRVHVVWAGGAFEGIGKAYDVFITGRVKMADWTDIKDIVALPSKA